MGYPGDTPEGFTRREAREAERLMHAALRKAQRALRTQGPVPARDHSARDQSARDLPARGRSAASPAPRARAVRLPWPLARTRHLQEYVVIGACVMACAIGTLLQGFSI